MKFSPRNVASLGLAALVLMTASGVVLYSALRKLPPARAPHLATLLPSQAPGFAVRDEPLGATENSQEVVERALKYDDYVYRVYRRGDLEVAVYAAYWAAGKLPIREVAQHTPDRCWTDNGFRCVETRFDAEVALAGVPLRPGDYRTFTTPREGRKIWVAFWLMAGSERYDFGSRFNALVHPSEWFTSAFKNMRLGRRELYFVRVSANQPLDVLRTDSALQPLGAALRALGLGRPPDRP
jgi:hypothetical protein